MVDKPKRHLADVRVESEVWIQVYCSECEEDLPCKVESEDDNVTVVVEPHKCKAE